MVIETQVKKIKNAKDAKSVESMINTFILEMEKDNMEDYLISISIRRLDIAFLMLAHKNLSDQECVNVKLARKILINKIVYGITLDAKKKIK